MGTEGAADVLIYGVFPPRLCGKRFANQVMA